MSERASYEKGKIIIDWADLVSFMKPEDMKYLMADAAFSEFFIEMALEIVATGGTSDPDYWLGAEAMHKMRAKLVPLMDQITQKTIEEANELRARADKWNETQRTKHWATERERDTFKYSLKRAQDHLERLKKVEQLYREYMHSGYVSEAAFSLVPIKFAKADEILGPFANPI